MTDHEKLLVALLSAADPAATVGDPDPIGPLELMALLDNLGRGRLAPAATGPAPTRPLNARWN